MRDGTVMAEETAEHDELGNSNTTLASLAAGVAELKKLRVRPRLKSRVN